MDLRNRKLYVIEVQKNLQTLCDAGCPLPYIIPDGVYGRETRSAVREFQKTAGLTPNGIVDLQTYEALCQRAQNARKRPGNLCAEIGEKSDDVLFIQYMLREMEDYDFRDIRLCGEYDDKTADAVRKVQKIHGKTPDGRIDPDIGDCIIREYHFARKRLSRQ